MCAPRPGSGRVRTYYGEAVEAIRVVGDDGRVGHAEFTIGGVLFYLAGEYPEYGVISPRTAGATTVTMHLTVADVDATYSRAVAAGARSLSEPADQPHGARHGTIVDPFGHRWMLSQPIETVDTAEYARRMAGSAFTVTDSDPGAAPAPGAVSGSTVAGNGRIWAAVNATDAPAMIRFMVDVLGFTEQLVVPGADPGVIEHSQLHWPDGGVVQVASANRPDNPFSEKPVGVQSLYLITDAPTAVYERCVAAAVSVLMPPTSPDYDPTGMVFTIEDHEGNLWSVGTYAGEA